VPQTTHVDLLALHARWPERYPYLLESVGSAGGLHPHARWDILFALPGERITLKPGASSAFLPRLDAAWQKEGKLHPPSISDLGLPFMGGWFLYLGYELAEEIEPILDLPSAPGFWPVAEAVRVPAAILRDHQTGELHVQAETSTQREQLVADIADISGETVAAPLVAATVDGFPDDRDYQSQVERAQAYIHDGDIFQANLARRWQLQLQGEPSHAEIYAALRESNPGPFAALVTDGSRALISSSPERLVSVAAGLIQTRPIAGTRPRSNKSKDESQADSAALLAHPKERAEHVMLIDLERNDLGRVCQPGTVKIDEMMVTESYAHVHHIVSNISGQLREGVTPGEIISAVFPGGTITGCPKVRCMQIIAELEGVGRGVYTGSVGYLNHNGDMDLNILIRTLERHGNQISVQAGAGIVADSNPLRETAETLAKARGPLRALGVQL